MLLISCVSDSWCWNVNPTSRCASRSLLRGGGPGVHLPVGVLPVGRSAVPPEVARGRFLIRRIVSGHRLEEREEILVGDGGAGLEEHAVRHRGIPADLPEIRGDRLRGIRRFRRRQRLTERVAVEGSVLLAVLILPGDLVLRSRLPRQPQALVTVGLDVERWPCGVGFVLQGIVLCCRTSPRHTAAPTMPEPTHRTTACPSRPVRRDRD